MRDSLATKKKGALRKAGSWQNGEPLRLVRLPSLWEGEPDQLGVVDAATGRVCVGFSATLRPTPEDAVPFRLPDVPPSAGRWLETNIGGVSRTQRLTDVLRGRQGRREAAYVFATGCPDGAVVASLFGTPEWTGRVTVGDPVWDAVEGWVVEVVVHDSERDLTVVAARIARAGAEAVLEGADADASRSIGIERLDRIDAEVCHLRDERVRADDGLYGVRRGADNWCMKWQPREWRLPSITWDQVVINTKDTIDLHDMPRILVQHVAKYKLEHREVSPIGAFWRLTTPPTPEEAASGTPSSLKRHLLDGERRWKELDGERVEVRLAEALRGATPRAIAQSQDGQWYECVDEEALLRSLAHSEGNPRVVSSHLSERQSRQLIAAFYCVAVERHACPEVVLAARLVLFHYMIHVGYTARWMGQYRQNALHVGNGGRLRRFKRLGQYDPARLPTKLLNRWLGADGIVVPNGSASVERRGSRSKFAQGESAYVPKKRMKRTRTEEEQMLRR